MAQNSKIEWCDHTVNLWHGCVEVHEGCDNCYAKAQDKRFHAHEANWGSGHPRLYISTVWSNLLRYQMNAESKGIIQRVFVGSMMDIFEKPMSLRGGSHYLPENIGENKIVIEQTRKHFTRGKALEPFENTGQIRDFFFNVFVPLCPNLIFLFLTKRPSNINKYIPDSWKTNPPRNVMFGTSVVNQETADKLIPQLLEVKGKKFLSCEPLLGPVLLNHNWLIGNYDLKGQIDWIICGGESGHKARPMHPDWARSLRDQCKAAGVPFLFKQWGEWSPIDEPSRQDEIKRLGNSERWMNAEGGHGFHGESVWRMRKVGKKEAGRLLDGVEHNEFPTI